MGRAEKVMWECDSPGCGMTESKRVHSRYDESPPKGWAHVNVDIAGEDLTNEGCECQCHEYDDDYENTPGAHDEEDCECQEWIDDDRGDFYLCQGCTQRLKQQFIKPRPAKSM